MSDRQNQAPKGPAQALDQAWVPSRKVAAELVERFGTPTYIYDRDFAQATFTRLRGVIDRSVDIFYSLKANPNLALTGEVCSFGAGAEVSSLTELRTALRAGVDPQDVIFVGPAKSADELEAWIDQRIYAVVCESLAEIEHLEALARQRSETDTPVQVMIRVNPAFTGGGSGLTMSGKPKQFGIDEEQVRALGPRLRELTGVDVLGFHIYMGTRFLSHEAVLENTQKILDLALSLSDELDVKLRAVDVGGGLGVPYFDNENAIDVKALSDGLNALFHSFREAHPDARLIVELGRFLVAGCGVMLTRVRYLKESRGESFAIADGGTNVHMAAVGLGGFAKRNFPVVNFSGTSDEESVYTVTGPLCTPNDTLAKRASLPEVAAGDILGVLFSGAYGPSASPTHFLSHGYPAEVMMLGEDAQLVRRREEVDDMLAQQQRLERR